MKSYRVSVLVMIMATVIMAGVVDAAEKKPRSVARHKQFKHKIQAVKFKVKRKRLLKSQVATAKTNHPQDENAGTVTASQHKPLDLAVPFKGVEAFDTTGKINSVQENSGSALFTENNKKSQQALQLKGQVVMSQELEADKRKSVDGAGIMINLRR